MIKCKGCNTDQHSGQWWNLNNYFGLSGRFCSDCYDKASHNSYQEPTRPKDYMLMLLKLTGAR